MRRPFPTDAELSQRLVEHRKDFEQLVAMAKADNELVRIAPDLPGRPAVLLGPAQIRNLGSHHKDGMNIAIFFTRSE
jgi:hypothetical protein